MTFREFREEAIKVARQSGAGLPEELVVRLARLAWGYKESHDNDSTTFKTIATDWYKQARRDGFFNKDKGSEKDDKRHHSFWSFAHYMDQHWVMGATPRSPWVSLVRWLRRVRYNIKRSVKNKHGKTRT